MFYILIDSNCFFICYSIDVSQKGLSFSIFKQSTHGFRMLKIENVILFISNCLSSYNLKSFTALSVKES